MRILVLVCILFSISGLKLNAQVEKFGKLTLSNYDFDKIEQIDPTAGAYVLFEKGKVSFNGEYEMYLDVHERVWIKNETGFDNADVTIKVFKGYGQNIYDLNVAYYLPRRNGNYEKKKLSKKQIFKQKGLNSKDGLINTNFTFTIPELEPGVIFEYTYRITRSISLANMPYWEFQKSIPVVYSEFETVIPEQLQFDVEYRGALPITNSEESSYVERRNVLVAKMFSNGVGGALEDKVVTIYTKKYTEMNIPAYVQEPFSLSTINCISSIQLHLKQWPLYNDPPIDLSSYGGFYNFFKLATDWKTYKSTDEIKELAKNITFSTQSVEEKVDSVMSFVLKNYSNNNSLSEIPTQKLEEFLKNKKGNSAELTLLAILLLKEHKVSANPLMINTNNQPIMKPQYVSPLYFNDMVIAFEMNNSFYFIDILGKSRKLGIYGSSSLNSEALYFSDNRTGFLDVRNFGKNSVSALINAKLDKEGTLSGSINLSLLGYMGLPFYTNDNDNDLKEVVSKLWFNNTPISIDSVDVTQSDHLNPSVKVKFNFEWKEYVQFAGSNIILNPFLFKVLPNSPFTAEKRYSDIYLPNVVSDRIIYKIEIPEGYKLSDNEAGIVPLKASYGEGKIEYKNSFLLANNILNGNVSFSIKDRIIKVEEYDRFKQFYEALNIAEEKTLYLIKE
jgi:hypothetical protein